MQIKIITCTLLFATASALSSCSLGRSINNDINSSNPAISQQAQKVEYLQTQVKDQQKIVDTEKSKLDGLEQQLAGAKQNLKGVKTQAKTN